MTDTNTSVKVRKDFWESEKSNTMQQSQTKAHTMKFINKFGIVVGAIFASMFMVLAAAFPAAATTDNSSVETRTVCSTGQSERLFDSGSSRSPSSTTMTLSEVIPAGSYSATIVTGDSYENRVNVTQSSERVSAFGIVTNDVPDNVATGSISTSGTATVPSATDTVAVAHVGDGTSPNSVYVTSICFQIEVEVEVDPAFDVNVSQSCIAENLSEFTINVTQTQGDTVTSTVTLGTESIDIDGSGSLTATFPSGESVNATVSNAAGFSYDETFTSDDCPDVVATAPVIMTECIATDLVSYTVTGEGVSVTVNGEPAELTGEAAPGDVIVAVSTIEGNFGPLTSTASVTVEGCDEIASPPPVIVQECLADGSTLVTVVFPGNPTYTGVVSSSGPVVLTDNGLGGFAFTGNAGDSILATSTFDPNFGSRFDVSTTVTVEDCSIPEVVAPTPGVITFECAADGLIGVDVVVNFDNDSNVLTVDGVEQELNTATGASYTIQYGDVVVLTSTRDGEIVATNETAPAAEDCEELDELPVTGSATVAIASVGLFLMLAGSAMAHYSSRRRLA